MVEGISAVDVLGDVWGLSIFKVDGSDGGRDVKCVIKRLG